MKAGSVVELKSGGPQMTVSWIKDAEAMCLWFVGEKGKMENKQAMFPLHALRLLEE
jgi:uncharacterized protein YodC (DUF2158 family)